MSNPLLLPIVVLRRLIFVQLHFTLVAFFSGRYSFTCGASHILPTVSQFCTRTTESRTTTTTKCQNVKKKKGHFLAAAAAQRDTTILHCPFSCMSRVVGGGTTIRFVLDYHGRPQSQCAVCPLPFSNFLLQRLMCPAC